MIRLAWRRRREITAVVLALDFLRAGRSSRHRYTRLCARQSTPFSRPTSFLAHVHVSGLVPRSHLLTQGNRFVSGRIFSPQKRRKYMSYPPPLKILTPLVIISPYNFWLTPRAPPQVQTYRFQGHSPADPEHERGRKEEKRWARATQDPITIFETEAIEAGVFTKVLTHSLIPARPINERGRFETKNKWRSIRT